MAMTLRRRPELTEISIPLSKRIRNWGVGFAIWTLVGLSFASRSFFTAYKSGSNIAWQDLFTAYLIDFYVIGASSPLIFRLSRVLPVDRGRTFSRLILHLGFSILFTFTVYPISLLLIWYVGYPNLTETLTLLAWFQENLLHPHFIHQSVISYWAILAAAHGFEYHRQMQIEKTQAAELASQLTKAQLAALKMQIHPHFLFNTLNSISALLHKDADAADRMIARLSDFLRLTLKSSNASIVTLEEELVFLRDYLEIEKIRFQDRLVVDIEIDTAALTARVPNLILQPIVENAVRHGVSKVTGTGRLSIMAKNTDGRLLIEIADNGPGVKSPSGTQEGVKEEGVGLANTRARLKQYFNDDFGFEVLRDVNNSGTMVRFNLPCTIVG